VQQGDVLVRLQVVAEGHRHQVRVSPQYPVEPAVRAKDFAREIGGVKSFKRLGDLPAKYGDPRRNVVECCGTSTLE
jgi:hypothetical protein